jgi:hypothetical protein
MLSVITQSFVLTIVMPSVTFLSGIMLSIVMMRVVQLNVVILNVFLLTVVALIFAFFYCSFQKQFNCLNLMSFKK